MDLGTIFGVLAGTTLLLTAIFLGSGLGIFWDAPSVMIVGGGTMAAVLIMFPIDIVLSSMQIAQKAFSSGMKSPEGVIKKIVYLAHKARKESLLALENEKVGDKFLEKGIKLVVDGTREDLVRSIMRTEISFLKQRHKLGQKVFRGMGGSAPAFGMIGTLIGLVQMLRQLNEPETIGPAMAVALITTFYGAILANLLFNPIATKLESRTEEEVLTMEVAIEGVISLYRGENPRLIQEKLHSFVAPKQRKTYTVKKESASRGEDIPGIGPTDV